MEIVGAMLKNTDEIKKFWEEAGYDILDITLALRDLSLFQEAFMFSLQFAEPTLMAINGMFKFNFQGIKKLFGIPEIYCQRNIEFKEDLSQMPEPKRDATALKYGKDEVKKRFDVVMQEIKNEMPRMAKELEKLQNNFVKQGIVNKEELENAKKNSIEESHIAKQIKEDIEEKREPLSQGIKSVNENK